MTTLRLEFDRVWAEADLEAEPLPAARTLVLDRWRQEDLPADESRAEELAAGLARVFTVLRTENPPPELALLLYPRADEGLVALATLRAQAFDGPVELPAVARELRLPGELLAGPAEEDELLTGAGPALRLVQRPRSPGEDQVQEHVVYLWLFDDGADGPVLITLSTAFEDVTEAGRWRPALDELARGLALGAPPRA